MDTEEAREWLERLPPPLRHRFEEGFRKWRKMPEDQRSRVRERFAEMHRKITESAEAAYKASGLQLDEEGRQRFLGRYFERRRELEEGLLRELERKRGEELPKLEAELKAEFSADAPPTDTSSGGDTP